jgi:hypothetical protein
MRTWRELVWVSVFVLLFGAALVANVSDVRYLTSAGRGLGKPCGRRAMLIVEQINEFTRRSREASALLAPPVRPPRLF